MYFTEDAMIHHLRHVTCCVDCLVLHLDACYGQCPLW